MAQIRQNTLRAHAGLEPLSKEDLPTYCPDCSEYHLKDKHTQQSNGN